MQCSRRYHLIPNLLGTACNARVEFYDKFQREADEYDSDFMKKYDEDLNTTLIFVSILSPSRICLNRDSNFAGDSLVCSLPSHPLSLSVSKTTYNLITSKSTTNSSQLRPVSR